MQRLAGGLKAGSAGSRIRHSNWERNGGAATVSLPGYAARLAFMG